MANRLNVDGPAGGFASGNSVPLSTGPNHNVTITPSAGLESLTGMDVTNVPFGFDGNLGPLKGSAGVNYNPAENQLTVGGAAGILGYLEGEITLDFDDWSFSGGDWDAGIAYGFGGQIDAGVASFALGAEAAISADDGAKGSIAVGVGPAVLNASANTGWPAGQSDRDRNDDIFRKLNPHHSDDPRGEHNPYTQSVPSPDWTNPAADPLDFGLTAAPGQDTAQGYDLYYGYDPRNPQPTPDPAPPSNGGPAGGPPPGTGGSSSGGGKPGGSNNEEEEENESSYHNTGGGSGSGNGGSSGGAVGIGHPGQSNPYTNPNPTPPIHTPSLTGPAGGPPPSSSPSNGYGVGTFSYTPGGGYVGGFPIVLDLDGSGVEITELSQSTYFTDSTSDGLANRTAWAASGNGVLFFDPDNTGTIEEARQYIFTEWDPTATSDIEALRSVFDSNGDGVFDANDAEWANFKVMVTNADGSTTAQSLTQLGIASIDLTADATNIELPDGSVITGQTSFTKTDGSTGIVADTILVSEAQGFRVEEAVSVDSNGARTVVSTGYDEAGSLAFVNTSVSSADGASVVKSYDDNGDGVVDRMQTIDRLTNPDGSKTETVTNKLGAVAATAVLFSMKVTTVSADGSVETIERDSTGGGWFDQTEVRTTHPDGSRTIVVSELGESGAVIAVSTETVSADGLVRSDAIDRNGDGVVDVTITHTIVVNADGSRSETIVHTNSDGSIKSSVTETVSADGQSKTIDHDVDGDGAIDTSEDLSITVNGDGTTSSVLDVLNGDGSLRSSSTQSQSDDALIKTIATDQDGDGDIDLTLVDATVINTDGSRETTVTATNTDGSIRSMTKTTLSADKVSSEVWADLNQNGVFEATDVVQRISVDSVTQARTAELWVKNADGSASRKSTTTTSQDGLSATTTIDLDGDGDTDQEVFDITVQNADGSTTRTITTLNQDGSQRSVSVVQTSADGLSTTTEFDREGDGAIDSRTVSQTVLENDGSTTRTVSVFAGDNTTLLAETVSNESADRRSSTTSTDKNGDGSVDAVSIYDQATNGDETLTTTNYNPDGSIVDVLVVTTSADGLVRSESFDENGDGTADNVSTETTTLNADGSRTIQTEIENGDGSLRSFYQTDISDDGLVRVVQADADGDGQFEETSTSITTLNSDGSVTTVTEKHAQDGSLIGRVTNTTSDDGLSSSTHYDPDGDGAPERTENSQTVLLDDGGVSVTQETRDASGNLLRKSVSNVNDSGRISTEDIDSDGDGDFDLSISRLIADDGTITETTTGLKSDGSVSWKTVEETDATGLTAISRFDHDGDGAFERVENVTTLMNADGSTTTTILTQGADGTTQKRVVEHVSDDGLQTTLTRDREGDGVDDFVTVSSETLAQDGSLISSSTTHSADGTLVNSNTRTESADGRSITETEDLDGDGLTDRSSVKTLTNDGSWTVSETFFDGNGSAMSTQSSTVSSDGLSSTNTIDRDADGTQDVVATDTTQLHFDGSETRDIEHRDGQGNLLASETYSSNDDSHSTTAAIDLDGDGQDDFVTSNTKSYSANGDIVFTSTTVDGSGNALSSLTTTTSADGLSTTTIADVSAYGVGQRTTNLTFGGDGSSAGQIEERDTSGGLLRASFFSQSADQRHSVDSIDQDGDGSIDLATVSTIDANDTTLTTITEYSAHGSIDSTIATSKSANDALRFTAFDIDGDGSDDFVRSETVSYDASGNKTVTQTETVGVNVLGEKTTTTSGDGLTSISTTDVDGDGVIDITTTTTTQIHADGSRTKDVGSVFSSPSVGAALTPGSSTHVSADGLTTTVSTDVDGYGGFDVETTTEVAADGSSTTTTNHFDVQGNTIATSISSTSADGLITTIDKNGVVEKFEYSVTGNGSYVWENGESPSATQASISSSHSIDASGFDTWEVIREIVDPASNTGTSITVFTVNLDAQSKARILGEAARISDSVLDRALLTSESESLPEFITDGQLDKEAFASSLMNSAEYAARYESQSDAQYITQLHFNSFGRGPSMNELSDGLSKLADGATSREMLAVELADSAEHIVVGNFSMSTNNYDIELLPVSFERSFDVAAVNATIESIVEVAYDRPPELYELNILSDNLQFIHDTPADIVSALLATNGALQSGATSLFGLTGAALVQQAFANAFGRAPTSEELATWEANMEMGLISEAEFIAALAQSVEHRANSGVYDANAISSPSAQTGHLDSNPARYFDPFFPTSRPLDGLFGTTADDILVSFFASGNLAGGAGNDVLIGGGNGDALDGGAGDRDVASFISSISGVSVNLLLNTASGGDAEGDTITGIEDLVGSSFGDTLNGSALDNIIYSLGGNDYVYGHHGDDELHLGSGDDVSEGGVGADLIYGGAGNDNIWGDEDQDTIYGGAGDDQIFGGHEIDHLEGGAGDDLIRGGGYGDTILGGRGDDTIWGDTGGDTITGGKGNDWLHGGMHNDTFAFEYGDGTDTIADFSLTEDVVTFLNGDYVLDLADESAGVRVHYSPTDSILLEGITAAELNIGHFGTVGAGTVVFREPDQTIDGTSGKDTIHGASGNDTIDGMGDNDQLYGGFGNDVLIGGGGNNTLYGGAGDDTLSSGGGHDTFVGGTGNDTISGGNGSNSFKFYTGDGQDVITDFNAGGRIYVDDVLIDDPDTFPAGVNGVDGANGYEIHYGSGDVITLIGITATGYYNLARIVETGTTGDDVIDGRDNHDILTGLDGNDTLSGAGGDDRLYGNAGDDTLSGGDGKDQLFGGAGNDILTDTAGNSTLWGEAGDDSIIGGNGHDRIIGGTGNDALTGGGGRDTFEFATGDGQDVITDLDPAYEKIKIDGVQITDLTQLPSGVTGTQVGADFRLSYGSGDQLLIKSSNLLVSHYPTLFLSPDETLVGTSGADVLDGANGDDDIDGAAGDDTIIGGVGDDILTGGLGADDFIFDAGDGNDVIVDFDPTEDNLLIGGVSVSDLSQLPTGISGAQVNGGAEYILTHSNGDSVTLASNAALQAAYPALFPVTSQTITGTSGKDTLVGGAGDDTIDGLGDNDQLYGGAGDDYLTSTGGNNGYYGDAGDDVIVAGGGHDTFVGGAGNDTITGGNGSNSFKFYAGDGQDVITDFNAGGRIYVDDILVDDPANFPAGVTGVDGPNGYEIHYGSGDVITLTGLSASDYFDLARIVETGTNGDDVISGRENADILTGLAGNDTLTGAGGDDRLYGDAGDDILSGGDGKDQLFGGDGNDTLSVTSGNSTLWGEAGNDTITGGGGHDRVVGGIGDDFLTGGSGRDTFEFTVGDGADTIDDFNQNDDVIRFVGTGLQFANLTITDGTTGAIVDYGGGNSVTLENILAADLTVDDFQFL